MKIQPIFNKFRALLSNEENAPELLPYNFCIVFFFKELVNYRINLASKKSTIPYYFDYFEILKKIELDKIVYLLKNYHKIRIFKLEKNFGFKQNGKKFFNLLSQSEKIYARSYNFLFFSNIENFFSHFRNNKLKNKLQLTKKFFNENSITAKEFYVFFKVLNKKFFFQKNIFLFHIPSVSYETEIFCMKFNSIRRLIFSGAIFLI